MRLATPSRSAPAGIRHPKHGAAPLDGQPARPGPVPPATKPMINPYSKLALATRKFRQRYGLLRGTLLWLELLKEKALPRGRRFRVHVPGLPHPVTLRARTSDIEAFSQIFGIAELDVPSLPAEAGFIIDAGANIGLSSLFFAARYPAARILAIEIDKANIAVLRSNTAAYPNITVIEKGLWHRNATLHIRNPQAEPWAYQVEETAADDPGGFPAIGIQALMDQQGMARIDILKMDIEGAEREVFSDNTDWLARTGSLMIELHEHIKPGCKQALEAALSAHPHVHGLRGEYHCYNLGKL